MNARSSILFGAILTFLIFTGTRARAIPDFYTDEDLDAWHKFGLRSFYGPWSVVARKPNGDFVSYADYGARVPSDFRPISDEATDNDDNDDNDDSSRGISHDDRPERRYPSKYATGLSDFAAGYGLAPQGLAVFSNGVQIPDTEIQASPVDRSNLEDNAVTLNSSSDLQRLIKAVDGKATDKESKRDTLELIGIVGVISDEGDSSEEDSTTLANTEIATTTADEDSRTTVTDRSFNVTD